MSAPPPVLPRISDYAAWHAACRPDAEALKLDGRTWRYADLAVAVDRLARALLVAGVGKGDRVATLQPPHPNYLIDFLATASVGAIWVGLNPRYRIEELTHVLTDAEPAILLARRHIRERCYDAELEALAGACPSLRRIVLHDSEDGPVGTEPMADFLAAGDGVAAERLDAARAGCGARRA